MPFPGLSANFNEPQSNDPTSAPPMPDQVGQPDQGLPSVGGSLAAALSKRKKQGLINPTVKQPAALKSAIARARSARQRGDKYGS